MSRIGKKIIKLPANVTVSFANDSLVTVNGPKGILSRKITEGIGIEQKGDELTVTRPTEQKRHKALHGLYRSLINNMIIGVSAGFKKEMEVVGVGYKVSNQGNLLELSLGYSHGIFMQIPTELKISTTMEKGQTPKIILEGVDNELLGQVSAKIKSLRPVEPYKGKGILFVGEFVRRKAGKAGKAGKK